MTSVRCLSEGSKGKVHLEKGPNYINSLPNVLMAWRFDKVAYTGDVRKMFNQVLIHPDDQVFHRFLWRTNESFKPKVYQWKRLNFGDKPAPDIAAGAIITLAKASQDQYLEAAKELRTHVYVDDIGGSRQNEDKSKQITSEIDAILSKGQFKKVDQTDEEHVDFLGHKWNKVRDTITFKKTEIVAQEKPEIHGMPEIHGFCDAGEKGYGSAMFPWFAHGESLCLTPKEEVNTTLGVNGLSRALKVIPNV